MGANQFSNLFMKNNLKLMNVNSEDICKTKKENNVLHFYLDKINVIII